MAITLIFKGWVSIHAFILRIYNWITINLLWNSLFKDWILLVFFSMKKYSQIFLLLIHAKNILFAISPTTSYLKTRLFIGISVEEGSELKIAGPTDVLTLSNGWKMSEQTLLQHFKCFFELIHPWCSQEDTFIFKTTWKIKLNFKLFE